MTQQSTPNRTGNGIPEGLWAKCTQCGAMQYQPELQAELYVCRGCGHHRRLTARERIAITVDDGTFHEHDTTLRSANPLHFPNYAGQLAADEAKTGLREVLVWGEGAIESQSASLAVMDFGFRGGSMGAVVGEKFARAAEYAIAQRVPFVVIGCSGGARMQEGIVSLLQMAKTSAVVGELNRQHIPFIIVYSDPMTAGVFASFASLADVIISEQKALVGFAGPRVIEKAFKIKLPPGSHTAEFQYEHGMVDIVVARKQVRPLLGQLLRLMSPRSKDPTP